MFCQSKSRIVSIILISFLIFLSSCAGQAPKSESQQMVTDPPLSKKYENIIVFGFKSTPDTERDYPGAVKECQDNVIFALLSKNVYKSVAAQNPAATYTEGTLLVKAKVKELRIVGSALRILGGIFAGKSYMNLDISLIDAGTNKEVRKKELNSSTNIHAAIWTFGMTDRSLPSDMGKIIANYILTVVPKR